jgi:methionyl-tRNA synthetase
VVSFVRRGLEDLSISRSKDRFDWGIDIPWDDSHITYVWFDALLNYITAIGYGADETKLNHYWPANVQVVGKDILRFHAVIWPAMLMSAAKRCLSQSSPVLHLSRSPTLLARMRSGITS